MGEKAGHNVLIAGNKCYRCGHEWRPEQIERPPKVCPSCKNPYWDRPRRFINEKIPAAMLQNAA